MEQIVRIYYHRPYQLFSSVQRWALHLCVCVCALLLDQGITYWCVKAFFSIHQHHCVMHRFTVGSICGMAERVHMGKVHEKRCLSFIHKNAFGLLHSTTASWCIKVIALG